MRHCNALLRKHVLPVLLSPQPVLVVLGQVVSIGRVQRDLAGPDGACGAAVDDGVDGGGCEVRALIVV